MNNIHPIKEIVKQQKNGIPMGIFSICSANEYVIRAAMKKANRSDGFVLIEATANQVNQYGGYTGMLPADFKKFVLDIAEKESFPADKIILGGDHLGPLAWKSEGAGSAMSKASQLIMEYVRAGFTKIHIDTSMKLRDDGAGPLASTIIAERAAQLCAIAEEAFAGLKTEIADAIHPVYVIGSEVPVPGGIQDSNEEEGLRVTGVQDFRETVDLFKKEFLKRGLGEAWGDVVAVVVQPGVEFGDEVIDEYDRAAARELCSELKKYPNLVFEGHSTDYQQAASLKKMVEDGIAILKVGPALTFALREGLFLLNHIENELLWDNVHLNPSRFIEILEKAMLRSPENWDKYYHGSYEDTKIARKYSLSDRSRYYLNDPDVKCSIELLINNLKTIKINNSLIKQYFPEQYKRIRSAELKNDPEEILMDKVIDTLDDYFFAVG
ncbi:MAG: D-tagatose-bisphosphate aldolase class accessory protein AgaZ [Eubacterium sp.]|jgi:D-tagatose-1,6-bisphosphate aldolase subunit GatZ/KbaZ|nr:D-tagatose-bisphosphate aldolase class accessory protein AgaZ [Eubacterium sp.]